ncbi:peptidase C39 [Laribacter hongkongensis]|uniref:C39 family peptidase n=1 Tax=Laribacter hongkongensis TaxID=168471 RepID=UPI0019F63835|nr:C39 family peptidase [Laribacter hongkongensis]MBE5528371.1 peptidase C39 [Laribacter hongkongensis]
MRVATLGHLVCAALAAPFFLAGLAQADTLDAPLGSLGATQVRVESLKERAFRYTVRQQYDFSCGSAALATLLTYHYATPTGEEDTFKAMFDAGDQERIRQVGFSMADMKRYLASHGFDANGFEVSLDTFASAGIPAIVLIDNGGYRHFVVLKGMVGNKVLLGDPALGLRIMPRDEFEQTWGKVVFIITNRKSLGQQHFNQTGEWQVRQSAPLALSRFDPSFANTSVLMRGPNDF